jgi:hypothetical protein
MIEHNPFGPSTRREDRVSLWTSRAVENGGLVRRQAISGAKACPLRGGWAVPLTVDYSRQSQAHFGWVE